MSHIPPPVTGSNPFADQPLPPANYTNPYAPPAIPAAYMPPQQKGLEGLWRRGDELIAQRWASFPPVCVKSNQPTEKWLKRNLQWHTPWLFILLISPLIYLIVALLMTHRATINIALTDEWLARRRRHMLIAWTICLSAVLLFVAAIVLGSQGQDMEPFLLLMIPALFMLIGGALYGTLACRLVYASRINETHVWIKGIHRDFLNRLPDWPYTN